MILPSTTTFIHLKAIVGTPAKPSSRDAIIMCFGLVWLRDIKNIWELPLLVKVNSSIDRGIVNGPVVRCTLFVLFPLRWVVSLMCSHTKVWLCPLSLRPRSKDEGNRKDIVQTGVRPLGSFAPIGLVSLVLQIFFPYLHPARTKSR